MCCQTLSLAGFTTIATYVNYCSVVCRLLRGRTHRLADTRTDACKNNTQFTQHSWCVAMIIMCYHERCSRPYSVSTGWLLAVYSSQGLRHRLSPVRTAAVASSFVGHGSQQGHATSRMYRPLRLTLIRCIMFTMLV